MSKRRIYLEDIPLDEALDRLRAAMQAAGKSDPLPGESAPLAEALGRVTAKPIRARRSSPHFHCAAMDGYAVAAAATAGARETQPLKMRLGEAAFPVNTGDPLPENTNAVIMIEHVNHADADTLLIYASAPPWQHTRLMGEDMVATETVLQVSHPLRPVDLGALAGSGHERVCVRRKPRVHIIPTGDELVPLGQEPGRGQLVEYNSLILGAQIQEWGGEAHVSAIVSDDEAQLRAALKDALAAKPDLILALSGSSAGAKDFTAAAIADLGEVLAHGIAVRPGHPVILGLAESVPVIGVPGYPVSAALTGELFVLPLLRQWLGLEAAERPVIEAAATRKIASPIGDDDFLRVALAEIDGRLLATPLQRGAGVISSLTRADGLAQIPRFHEGVDRGAALTVSLYRPLNLIRRTLLVMGSHDPMLDLLAAHLRTRRGQRMVSVNVGSLGGLIALRRGEAHLAGCHLFEPASASYNLPFLRRYAGDQEIALITFAHREQGLMLAPGNPLGIAGIADLPRARYVNRQRGAGTRVLLDYLLERQGIHAAAISGYAHEEATHLAVAAAVADGVGDCGMGLRGAAEALDLDFIGLTWERFDLAIPARHLESDGIQALLDALRDESFKRELGAQSGYRSNATGQVVSA